MSRFFIRHLSLNMQRASCRWHLFPALLLTAAAGLSAGPSAAVEPGTAATPFEVPGVNGPLKLSAYRGKLVYLDFWASWCGPCKRSFPWMNQMQAKYGAQGLQVVAVNLDAKRADADGFLSSVPAHFEIGFDASGSVAKSYGLKGMPSSVLIDPDGKVLAMHAGFREADEAELEGLISRNLQKTSDNKKGE